VTLNPAAAVKIMFQFTQIATVYVSCWSAVFVFVTSGLRVRIMMI
jgi:hypothetical protein